MQCRSVTMLLQRKRQPAALVILALQEAKKKASVVDQALD